MKIEVLLFAAAREACGTDNVTVELAEGSPLSDVIRKLSELYPALSALLPHLRIALNCEFAELSTPVASQSQVALIPPVSGGSGAFWLTSEPLRLEDVVHRVSHVGKGGIVTFTGVVRNQTRGKPVLRLEYEAYVPMAEKALVAIGDDVAARWPGTVLSVAHRYGLLMPGESAVVMAAAAPHRKEAFLACEYALERLKQDVPIWKKEFYEDGQVWVGLGA